MIAIQKRLINIRVRDERFSGINALSACLSGIASECIFWADNLFLGMNVKGRMIYLSERIVMRSDIPANKPSKLINSGERGCAETVLFPHNLFI